MNKRYKCYDVSQQLISSFVVGHDIKTYGSINPHQVSLTNSLVNNVIINCGVPISIVDNQYFRKFIADLDPKFSVPCRQTVSYSILPRMCQTKHDKLQGLLDSSAHLAMTADIWTDRRQHSFLGMTVHFFRNAKPISHLLAFRAFRGSHTGRNIAEALESITSEFNIQNKIRYIVTDNASNMKAAMNVSFDDGDESRLDDDADPSLWQDIDADEVVGTLSNMAKRRVPCFAHSLQLIVHDGLKSLHVIRLALGKCSKLANLLHQSALFRGAFETAMGAGKSVPSTNETRWNSTFRQLKAIIQLDQVKLGNVLRESSQANLILSVKELNQLQELVMILAPFAEATDLTQGDKMVTISCIVPAVLSLAKILNNLTQMRQGIQGNSLTFTNLVSDLIHGLHERFQGIFTNLDIPVPDGLHKLVASRDLQFDDEMFLMASALDPMYAYHWLDDHPGSYEEKQSIRRKIDGNCKLN